MPKKNIGQKTYTVKSTLREVVKNPVGGDVAEKLLCGMGMELSLLNSPLLSLIKIKNLPKLSGGMVDMGLTRTLVEMLNGAGCSEDIPPQGEYTEKWWKDMVVYQIYPRSFKDSDGDGVGDLRGIIEKLDYIAELGATAIWMSPIYDSPNDDNGYDIRDYRKIMAEFGTMEDFEELSREAHARGIRIIMDMVLNHTSDEHEWFKRALAGEQKYKDYYYFRDGQPDTPPNNWLSFFSGSAWNYYPQLGQWALHSFSKKQMDLNWENPEVRRELYDMMNFWLDKGVDGFRLDVINFISKKPGLPDGSDKVGEMMGFRGIEQYFFGPRLHEFLHEMRENTTGPRDAYTVGETPGTGLRMSRLLTSEKREELDTVFCFDHICNQGVNRYGFDKYDMQWLKQVMLRQQTQYGSDCWNALFFENHDNPRMVSKISDDPQYRDVVAKLIAVLSCTMCGTPYIYQGQELGMVNTVFTADELRDVEAINMLAELKQTQSEEEAMRYINTGCRDHARMPMQWDSTENAGFTTGTPWIKLCETDGDHNAEAEMVEDSSVYSTYHRLLALRSQEKAMRYGKFLPLKKCPEWLFCYFREYKREGITVRYYIEVNFSDKEQKRPHDCFGYVPVYANYGSIEKKLRPYEANIYRC